MEAFEQAVSIANAENNWKASSKQEAKEPKNCLLEDHCKLVSWRSAEPENDVATIGCVVYDTKTDEGHVIRNY